MSERRIEPEDLDALEGLPADDPRVRDLGPRERAQLRAFRDFVAPGDAPGGARLDDAEARLGAAIERELGVTLGGGDRPAADAVLRRQGGARPTGGLLDALFAPRMRPAFAIAALVIVAGGALLFTSIQRGPGEPVMRGDVPVGPADALTVGAPRVLPNGALRLEWTPSAEAQGYTVVFLTPDLTESARVSDVLDTHLDLRPGALPPGLVSGGHVLWRVTAMRGADEIARSRTAAITVP